MTREEAIKDIEQNILPIVGGKSLLIAIEALKQPEIIYCKDCKWWDREAEDSPMGYCHACKHSHYSRHWEINIRRTYEEDFFCADAEPKEEGEEDETD